MPRRPAISSDAPTDSSGGANAAMLKELVRALARQQAQADHKAEHDARGDIQQIQ